MDQTEMIITIAICVAATVFTRFISFAVFREGKEIPKYVDYLGKALPAALFAFLVIYCLKGVNVMTGTHGIPELIAIAATALIHIKWRKMLISIAAGTILYMVLVQCVFV